MIPQTNTAVDIDSNIQGNKIAMMINVAATGQVMGALAGLYTNSIRAVIREYSTNGRDAHIEVGYDGPIEVTLPNKFNPLLIIEDHGVGLTEEDIIEIYSQYGASTKRNTNDQQGCLGFGCKAALAYAQQFTLQSVKDHKRTTVVVSREEDGGSMTVTSVIDTTEANGTRVEIPTNPSDMERFEQEAKWIFSFWDEGTVLVNGEAPAQIEGLEICEDIKLISGSQDYVVMGGVAYPTTLKTGLNNRGIAAWVPIGSIEFAPSREGLKEDARITKDCKRDIEDVFKQAIDSAVQREIDACSNPDDALKAMLNWDHLMPKSVQSVNYTFKGQALPINYAVGVNNKMYMANRDNPVWTGYGKISKHSKETIVHAGLWPKTFWVKGYDLASYTAGTRKKIDKYLDDHPVLNRTDFEYYVVTEDGFTDNRKKVKPAPLDFEPWVMPAHVVDWSVIKAIKLPRNITGRAADPNRPTASYDLIEISGGDYNYRYGIESDDIDPDLPIFWCDAGSGGYSCAKTLATHHPDGYVVELTPNRIAKFERIFPTAKRAHEEKHRIIKKWQASIAESTKIAHSIQDDWRLDRDCRGLDLNKIDDPAIKKMMKLRNRKLTKVKEHARLLGTQIPTVDYDNPFDKYPLFDRDCSNKKHTYWYLNAAYAAQETN